MLVFWCGLSEIARIKPASVRSLHSFWGATHTPISTHSNQYQPSQHILYPLLLDMQVLAGDETELLPSQACHVCMYKQNSAIKMIIIVVINYPRVRYWPVPVALVDSAAIIKWLALVTFSGRNTNLSMVINCVPRLDNPEIRRVKRVGSTFTLSQYISLAALRTPWCWPSSNILLLPNYLRSRQPRWDPFSTGQGISHAGRRWLHYTFPHQVFESSMIRCC